MGDKDKDSGGQGGGQQGGSQEKPHPLSNTSRRAAKDDEIVKK